MSNTINCLDKGYITLIDYMGNDERITESARISYELGAKLTSDNKTLIRYLLRMGHTSPFESVEFQFRIKLPLFVMAQLKRQRTAKLNEISGRYSILEEEFYVPEISRLQKQAKNNKQGSDVELIDNTEEWLTEYKRLVTLLFENYHSSLDQGLARELSRIVLPQSVYTSCYWKIDLNNLFKFLQQRLDTHAQYEIRVYAEAMYELIKDIVPIATTAFEDYMLNAIKFSKQELIVLDNILSYHSVDVDNLEFFKENLSKREIKELKEKLNAKR